MHGRCVAIALALLLAPTPAGVPVPLPNKAGSLKFVAFGDYGDASARQYETAEQIAKTHDRFPFELVMTLGDNLMGNETAQDFKDKFETPYKPLLDSGVTFHAALGNHDAREERNYKPFNMDGKLFYTFKAPAQDVRFFVLESSYMDPTQLNWLDRELRTSHSAWKIVIMHHPLYSSGAMHGSSLSLRAALEPLFINYGVSVVLSGHDHIYERVRLQHGIRYFVVGSGGQLRRGNILRTTFTEVGFDDDNVFLAVEIIDDKMYFNAITRTGRIVDSGIIPVRKTP